jgi:hypothetical protein
MYLYLVLLCFCLRFSDSDSYSAEDSDYRIDNAADARTFEMKKRKLDEVEGHPPRRSRQSGKTPAEGSSAAAVGKHVKSKMVYSHGPHPPRKGRGAHGLVDVEKEQEIEGNLGSTLINTWRKLRLANPYCFHERRYTGNDKRF